MQQRSKDKPKREQRLCIVCRKNAASRYPMPLRNRVTPFGELIETSARGTLMGNRGCLVDGNSRIARRYQGRRWIACTLEFKGRRLPLMEPGHNTQLFFLDEATAMAAGHRPCMECRRMDFVRFREHWAAANSNQASGVQLSAAAIDAVLHTERITHDGNRVLYPEQISNLPVDSFIVLGLGVSAPYLVLEDRLLLWTPQGYVQPIPRPTDRVVQVLTPRSMVRTLTHGYRVCLHKSASESSREAEIESLVLPVSPGYVEQRSL